MSNGKLRFGNNTPNMLMAQEHNPNVRERERSNSQDFVPLLQKIFLFPKEIE
jgi:hypothetical protein